jgi:hypothetical protein
LDIRVISCYLFCLFFGQGTRMSPWLRERGAQHELRHGNALSWLYTLYRPDKIHAHSSSPRIRTDRLPPFLNLNPRACGSARGVTRACGRPRPAVCRQAGRVELFAYVTDSALAQHGAISLPRPATTRVRVCPSSLPGTISWAQYPAKTTYL